MSTRREMYDQYDIAMEVFKKAESAESYLLARRALEKVIQISNTCERKELEEKYLFSDNVVIALCYWRLSECCCYRNTKKMALQYAEKFVQLCQTFVMEKEEQYLNKMYVEAIIQLCKATCLNGNVNQAREHYITALEYLSDMEQNVPEIHQYTLEVRERCHRILEQFSKDEDSENENCLDEGRDFNESSEENLPICSYSIIGILLSVILILGISLYYTNGDFKELFRLLMD